MIKYVLLYKDGSLSYMDDWKEKFDLIEYMQCYHFLSHLLFKFDFVNISIFPI